VVRVTEEVGGLLLAEALGLPHATVGSGNAHRMAADAIMSSVDRLRRELGLPTGVDPYPSLFASFVPRSYPGNPAVPTIRWYRQRDPERIGERMPDWFADLPADRPVVYVAIGSWLSAMVWKTKPQIEAVVTALEAMDCTGIVAVGDAAAEHEIRLQLPVRMGRRVDRETLELSTHGEVLADALIPGMSLAEVRIPRDFELIRVPQAGEDRRKLLEPPTVFVE